MAVLLAGLCILSVAILLYAEERGLEALRAASKISASLFFIGVALFSGAMETAPGLWILAGLVLSLAGDALLLSSQRIIFLCGMAAFGLAHIAYTAGFWVSGTASLNDWGRSLFLTLVFTGLALRYLWPRLLPPWRGAVLAYTVIIGLMMASAFAGGMAGHLAMGFVVAAAAFAISDISVARDRLTAHDPRSRRWGLPLYYASQLLFAFSIAI